MRPSSRSPSRVRSVSRCESNCSELSGISGVSSISLHSLAVSEHAHGFGNSSSNMGTLMNFVKAMVGTGILAMPAAFSHSGLMLGLGLLLLLASICTHCMHLLVTSAHTLQHRFELGSLDYTAVMREAVSCGPAFSRKWAYLSGKIVTAFLLITQFGFCCVYILFVSQNVKQVVHNHLSEDPGLPVYVIIIAALLIPYCFIKSLRLLSYFALVANVFTMVGMAIVFIYVFSHIQPWTSFPLVTDYSGVALFFGTAIFAFEGIGIVLPLENSMKNPGDLPGWAGVLNLGMVIVSTLYVAMGFYGYLTFGSDSCGSITLNLPHDNLHQSVKIIFAFGVFISYGLQMYVPTAIIWPWCRERLGLHVRPKTINILEYVFRAVFVIATAALAIAIPYLELFISLIGSLCSSLLALIFPVVIDICVRTEVKERRLTRTFRNIKNFVIFIVGFLGFIVGTYETIRSIIEAFKGESDAGSVCNA